MKKFLNPLHGLALCSLAVGCLIYMNAAPAQAGGKARRGGPNLRGTTLGLGARTVNPKAAPVSSKSGVGCQNPDQLGHGAAGTVGATSDGNPNAGFAVAESFTPTAAGNITDLTFWGFYVNFSGPVKCGPGTGDSFTVTYFSDAGAIPGAVLAGPLPLTINSKFDTGNDIATGIGAINEWQFEGTHDPVPVTAGTCVWVEIQNTTAGDCFWLWSTAPAGDNRAAQDAGTGYAAVDYDLAFCINLGINADGCGIILPPGCGEPGAGDCCTPNGSPACDDLACCSAICALDPFCCDTEWDGLCADAAVGNPSCPMCVAPGGCGAAAANDCCTAGPAGVPGCTDETCCNTVCACDPFCCDTDWDVNCVGPNAFVPGCSANDLCGGCGGGGGVCGAGAPGGNDCNTAGPVAPGCTDETCCNTVCACDPFCCATDWDVNCVGPNAFVPGCSALDLCGGGGNPVCGATAPGGNDCNTAGPIAPGCTDETCCNTVCACDPFCCATDWDVNCVGPNAFVPGCSALDLCGGGGGGPDNDACADRIVIGDGVTAYSNVGATTDGPNYLGNPDCGVFGDDNVHNDIWFNYSATCSGILTVTTCEQLGGSADYDSRLSIHEGCECAPLGPALACNDDDPVNPCGGGGGGFHSTMQVEVTSGQCYKIRVGGFGAGDEGNGTLFIDCESVEPPVTGACCDPNTGVCTDNVEEADCNSSTRDYAANVAQAIPDGNQAGISHVINVPDGGSIDDVNVDLNISHTFTGDICVTLEHGGTSVELVQRNGANNGSGTCHPEGPFGCGQDNLDITLDDEGAGGPVEALCVANASSPPNFVPFEALSAFDGMDKSGDWTITVSDNAGLDTGTFNSWALHITNAGTLPPEFHANTLCADISCGAVCGDGTVQAGEDCDDGNTTDGDCCSSTCTFEASGSSCGAGPAVCSGQDTCDGAGNCLPNHDAAGTNCGDGPTVCSQQDTCNGSGACLPNNLPAGTECRPAADECDVAETCDGAGSCPADVTITTCGPADGCCPVGCTNDQDTDCPIIDEPVPTMSQWGMLALGSLLIAGLVIKFRRRRVIA